MPSTSSAKRFEVGEVIWGPHGSFPSWPGKLLKRISGSGGGPRGSTKASDPSPDPRAGSDGEPGPWA